MGSKSGGRSGLRGYIVQALVCATESISDELWSCVQIEADDVSEKVDIRWTYPDGVVFAQIKSREGSAFSKSDAEGMMDEFTKSTAHFIGRVKRHDLYLVGHWNTGLIELSEATATIGTRRYLMGAGASYGQLLEVAAARLRDYAERIYPAYFSETQGQMLICTFMSFINTSAIKGQVIDRADFLKRFADWVNQFRPAFTDLDDLYVKDRDAFQRHFEFRVDSAITRKLYRELAFSTKVEIGDLKRCQFWIEPSDKADRLEISVPKREYFVRWCWIVAVVFSQLVAVIMGISGLFSESSQMAGFLSAVCMLFVSFLLIVCSNVRELRSAERVKKAISAYWKNE